MTMGQMLLVLLASVLFATISLSINNSIFLQSELVVDQMLQLQAQKIADRFHQKIDAELLGDVFPFDNLPTEIATYDSVFVIRQGELDQATFSINFQSNFCDSSGDVASPDPDFQRVDIRITTTGSRGKVLRVGTQNDPVFKVYGRLGIY